MKEKNNDYEEMKNVKPSIVYVIQEIPGTKEGRPKINIMGASEYGKFKFLYNLLKWDKQERQYYPIQINLYERGKIDEQD